MIGRPVQRWRSHEDLGQVPLPRMPEPPLGFEWYIDVFAETRCCVYLEPEGEPLRRNTLGGVEPCRDWSRAEMWRYVESVDPRRIVEGAEALLAGLHKARARCRAHQARVQAIGDALGCKVGFIDGVVEGVKDTVIEP